MSSSRTRKRSRGEAAMSPGDNPTARQELQSAQDADTSADNSSGIALERRYETRRSTQETHPGVNTGLAKRFKADIQAEAAQKKKAEDEKREKAEKRKQAKESRERDAAKVMASMQDERARREKEDMEAMETTPSADEGSVQTPTRDAGALADERVNRRPQRSFPDAPQALDIVHTGDDPLHHAPKPRPVTLKPTLKTTQSSQVQFVDDLNSSSEGDSSDFEEVHQVVPTQSKSQRKRKGKATSSLGTQMAAEGPAPKLTEAQKKAARVNALRSEIAAQRGVQSQRSEGYGSRPPRGQAMQSDAFTADYRVRMRAGTPAPVVAHSSSVSDGSNVGFTFMQDDDNSAQKETAATKSPSFQDPWLAATFTFLDDTSPRSLTSPRPSSSRTYEPRPLSDEEIGGLDEEVICALAPTPLKKNMRVVRGSAKNTMVGILPNSLIEGDQVVDSPKKHARASRKQVSLARSRAFMALPPWIQPTIISIIVPSLIKFYGSRDEPWNIDGPSSNIFANLFNALLARLHPGHENTISKSDKVWRYCRQSIYDWRSNFAKLAVQLVGKAAKAQGTSAAIKIWAEGALAKGGEATYSQPNLRNPSAARGALQTPLFVQLLAAHYAAAEGAIIETSYPVGALSLASVAIRRAFTAWRTGTFVAPGDFDENTYGKRTTQVRNGAVAGLLDFPHRFDALVARAITELPSFQREEAEHDEQAANDEDAYGAVDPPTSPPAADQY